MEVHKDGRAWRVGTAADVRWMTSTFRIGVGIDTAVPPVFAAYATVVSAEDEDGGRRASAALVRTLREHSTEQRWWLGYLDNGVDDVVFPDAPRVRLYADWPYVLVLAGPDQALTWRQETRSWHGPGPSLLFPEDRSWLATWLWDDDWRCIGGPVALVDALAECDELDVRRVRIGEDATPPGFESR